MTMGAERAEAGPEGLDKDANRGWIGTAGAESRIASGPEEIAAPAERRGVASTALATLLAILAAAWTGAFAWSFLSTHPSPDLGAVLAAIPGLSAPLILLALLWIMLGRSSRREAERFSRAVETMRGESIALQAVLENVSARIEDNHTKLRGEADRLMTLGEEASDRLGRVTYYLAKESATLDRQAVALDAAAAAARVDIGILLHDLPRAEDQARAVAEAMKEAGLAAHGHATALEAEMSALAARGREADEQLGNSAQRLAAHVARIDSSAKSAAASIGEASDGMNAAVDSAMARAADAVDAARISLDTQAAAVLASIEQSRAAFDGAGEEAARGVSARLDEIGVKVEKLAARIAAQDSASQELVTRLATELGELDRSFDQLARVGASGSERLAEGISALRDSARALAGELGQGGEQAGELIARAREISDALARITSELSGPLPESLERVENAAARTRESAAALVPAVDEARASAEMAAARVAEAEAAIARQRETLESLIERIGEGGAGAEAQLRAVVAAAAEARETSARIAAETGPELIEALLRVREAAASAAERAREAIHAAIPESAAALGEAGSKALAQAIGDTVQRQIAALAALSEESVTSARQASERLTRQMLALGEAGAALETSIEEERRGREAKERENLSRRVALLIESLNSTAIDVTKILSNEVTDSAWTAYLKGDRGVFTRRAVRLLDNREAREIAGHYEAEPEFREQVNRYVHDFEAMLRPILADRDGSALGITLLSSDMGKLYVILAQGIERLRV